MANKHYKTPQGLIYKVKRVLQQGKYNYALEESVPRFPATSYPTGYARIIKVCESKQKAYELLLRYLEKAYIDFEKKIHKDNKKLSDFATLLRNISYNAYRAYENKIELCFSVYSRKFSMAIRSLFISISILVPIILLKISSSVFDKST